MSLDNFIALSFCFLTGLIIVSLLVKDFCRSGSSYIFSFVLLGMALSYVVAPISISIFGVGHLGYSGYSNNFFVVSCAVILVFFIGLFFGEVLSAARSNNVYLAVGHRVNHDRLVLLVFFVSVASFLLFVHFYGGFSYVVENISRIRSGTDENKSYLGAFFRLFTYYILFVLFFLFARMLLSSKGLFSFSFLLFLSVLLLALVKSFLDGGRGGLILNFVGLIFVYNLCFRRLPLFYIFLILPLLVFVILFGKEFLFQIFSRSGSGYDLNSSLAAGFESFISNYSHQYMSMNVAIGNSVIGDRLFMDFVYLFLKPLKLVGVDVPDSISYFNTFQIKGAWDSEVPPGIILFSLYEGGILFVPIAGFVSGYILRWIDVFIVASVSNCSGLKEKSFIISVSVILVVYVPFAYGNADPALFVQWFFSYIVLFLFLYSVRVLRLRKASFSR